MKTMKRMAALVLCLSLLIGIPCAVQAVGTTAPAQTFELFSVYAMNKKMDLAWNAWNDSMADYMIMPYFNGTDRYNWMVKNMIDGKTTATLEIFVEPYDVNGDALAQLPVTFNSLNYYMNKNLDTDLSYPCYDKTTWPKGTIIPGAEIIVKEEVEYSAFQNKRVSLLQIDQSKGFSTWTDAAGFRFVIVDKEGQANDDVINGWRGQQYASQPYLKATETYNGRDAVIREILFEDDYLKVKTVTPISDSKVLINFSKPVAMTELSETGGPVKIELRATEGKNMGNNIPQPATVKDSWIAKSAKVLGNTSWVEVTFEDGAVAAAKQYQAENDTGLFLYVSDNSKATNPTWARNGEQVKNALIDGIWAADTKEPLFVNTGVHRDSVTTDGDHCYYWPTSSALPAIWSEQGAYDRTNLTKALDEAAEGSTVHLGVDVTVSERFLEVPAGVTLDLNGKNLTVENIFSFGDIIDSTDGKGSLVISNDKTQAFVGLQETNSYLPLYDTNCYRFFDYDVVSAGKKTGTNTVKFGVKVNFNNEKAYELLQNDGELVLDLMIGEQNIPYKFNSSTMTKLYNAVKADWTNRSKFAITLTISGLDNLPSDTAITATPELTSAGVLGTDTAIEYTYTSAQ